VSIELYTEDPSYHAQGQDEIGRHLLRAGKLVEVPTWQALDVKGKPQGSTYELCDFTCYVHEIPSTVAALQGEWKPNLPWAENQFLERVSGKPLNPGETYKEWPWYKGNVEQHQTADLFSHTYMERYWGRSAGALAAKNPTARRFDYRDSRGDLNDVVNLLAKQPTTRQAYLPVFWPEDTGAVHGERIPCSLGYLFLMRENKLNITYYIRSCDFYRHFRDDVYMTCRLAQWVLEQCQERTVKDQKYGKAPSHRSVSPWDQISVGRLTMHIGSLHVFEGDLPRLRRDYGTK
jgi:hypothetical protein